jgi:hypothetical protein
LPPYAVVFSFAVTGANLFAGGIVHIKYSSGLGVYLSTNNGTTWTAVNTGLTDSSVHVLAISGTNLFAGTDCGVFLSTNNGTNWTAASTGLTASDVTALAGSGTNLFAGTDGGVFLSTNNGTSWTAVNSGLTNSNVISLVVVEGYLFAGTVGGGVLRRPLSEMITSAQSSSRLIPVAFELHQNYPNPFNPSTTIKYELPRTTQVTLSVYDILGREVFVLVNDKKEAGVHEVKFDGSGLSSGVYFYRLTAGTFVETKKLLLVR